MKPIELDLSPTPIVINYKNQKYQMRFATPGELKAYAAEIKGKHEDETLDSMKNLVSSLGLPVEVYDQLDMIAMKSLIETLTAGFEKKS